MTAYREVRILSSVDAAYIAGLVDGEGSITLSRRHAGDRRQLVISISNTERPLLNFVRNAAGAGKITSKVACREHHARSYAYVISNRQALHLLRQIEPYLHSYKSERARLTLECYIHLTPRNGKYSRGQITERAAFIDRFFAITPHGKKQRQLIEHDVRPDR